MPSGVTLAKTLRSEIIANDLTMDEVAETINLSKRQLYRYLGGQYKDPIKLYEVVRLLRQANIIGNETSEAYVEEIKRELVYKREGPAENRTLFQKLLSTL